MFGKRDCTELYGKDVPQGFERTAEGEEGGKREGGLGKTSTGSQIRGKHRGGEIPRRGLERTVGDLCRKGARRGNDRGKANCQYWVSQDETGHRRGSTRLVLKNRWGGHQGVKGWRGTTVRGGLRKAGIFRSSKHKSGLHSRVTTGGGGVLYELRKNQSRGGKEGGTVRGKEACTTFK